jgi:hypothetical protein
MNTAIRVRDVIEPPAAWIAYINSPEREAAMRASGQLAADGATDGDASSVRAPDGFLRTRDVGAPPTQQGGTTPVVDLRNLNAFAAARPIQWGSPSGRIEAVDGGAGEVVDLRNLIPVAFFGAPR